MDTSLQVGVMKVQQVAAWIHLCGPFALTAKTQRSLVEYGEGPRGRQRLVRGDREGGREDGDCGDGREKIPVSSVLPYYLLEEEKENVSRTLLKITLPIFCGHSYEEIQE